MTKRTGLGDRLYVSGVDLSGDIGSIGSISSPRAVLPVTGINKEAVERLHGHRDGTIEFSAFFNDAAAQAHPTFKTLPTSDRIVSYFNGAAVGRAAAAMVGKQINYDGTRGEDGSLTFAVQALANGFGLEWGEQLTAGIRTDTGATNGASIDTAAAADFGLQAYLHVFAFTGTSCTITIEDSADDAAFAAVQAFTVVTTAPVAERIQTPRTENVRRYLRVATTGTFSNIQFAVVVVKNIAEVLF